VDINEDENLSDADKKQLKDFYLQNMIAPEARRLLEKHFPEEFQECPNLTPDLTRSHSLRPSPHGLLLKSCLGERAQMRVSAM
jgi:hypothetical protein